MRIEFLALCQNRQIVCITSATLNLLYHSLNRICDTRYYTHIHTRAREGIFRTRTGLNICKSMSEEYLLEHVLGLKRDQPGLCNFPISTTRPSYLWLPQKLKGPLPSYGNTTYLPQKIISSCEFLIRSTKVFALRIKMSASIDIIFPSINLLRIRGEDIFRGRFYFPKLQIGLAKNA